MEIRARLLFSRTFANFTVGEMRCDIAASAETLAERIYSPTAALRTPMDCNIRVNLGANTNPIFALDFDSTATTLWGINNTTFEYGTFSLANGAFTPTAVINGPLTAVRRA